MNRLRFFSIALLLTVATLTRLNSASAPASPDGSSTDLTEAQALADRFRPAANSRRPPYCPPLAPAADSSRIAIPWPPPMHADAMP